MFERVNHLLGAALVYAAREFRVFPVHSIPADGICSCGDKDCPSPGKHPRIGDWPGKATTDEQTIREWWAKWPDANIGLVTQGLLVVDRDGEGNEWPGDEKKQKDLEAAPTSKTPHGGRHYIFRQPPGKSLRNSVSKLGPKVDIRADAGYVLVFPSSLKGNEYSWVERHGLPAFREEVPEAPAWLVEAVESVANPPAPPAAAPALAPLSLPPSDDIERRAIAYLNVLPLAVSGEGGHGKTFAAARVVAHGFAVPEERAFDLLKTHYNPRCVPPWSDKELLHKVHDAVTKPCNQPRGWLRDRPFDPERGVDLSALLAFESTPPAGPPGQPAVASAEGIDEGPERESFKGPSDPGPFPKHLLSVPGFIEEVVAYTLSTAHRPQPVLSLGAAICLQCVLAARKVMDGRGNRTQVYILGIAESGRGKDHPRKVNKNILFQSGQDHLVGNEDFASDSGLLKAVETEPAILFQVDEIGRMLRTIREAHNSHLFHIATALMRLYSDADTIFHGKAYADATRNVHINQPCVSLFGLTTPSWLFDSLSPESLSDGFLARLLLFEGDPGAKRQRAPFVEIPDRILGIARWWGEFGGSGDLFKEHPKPVTIPSTPEADAIFDKLAVMVDAEAEKSDAVGKALWARVEENACRLAMVYACSADRENLQIGVDAARWACDLSAYITRRMLYLAHQNVAESEFDVKQKRILRFIREAGGRISQRAFGRGTRWMSVRDRGELLENLLVTGQVREETIETAGRRRTEYVLAV